MPEPSTQRTVLIEITRERPTLPKTLAAIGFRLRQDKTTGLIDLFLQGHGSVSERVIFDPVLIRSNVQVLNKYAAKTSTKPDDAAERDDVAVTAPPSFANIVHFSHMGDRAETIFGVFSLADHADALRTQATSTKFKSIDVLSAMSTLAFQLKLLREIVSTVENQSCV